MLVPLEIAILLLALSVSLVWDALRREESSAKRAAMVLSAIGVMMIAIAGRFPLPPGVRGFSPFVTTGAMIVVAGFVFSGLFTLVAVVRKRRLRGGPTRRAE
jgi:hypothetical protein